MSEDPLLTDTTLRCSRCKTHKPFDEFRSNSANVRCNGRHNECRVCDSASHADYYRRNKRKITSAAMFRQYGITIEQYEMIEAAQGYRCALCGEPEVAGSPAGDGTIRRLAVDHCHDTGRVRGLLCFKCNTALGRVAETRDKVQALINYVMGESCT